MLRCIWSVRTYLVRCERKFGLASGAFEACWIGAGGSTSHSSHSFSFNDNGIREGNMNWKSVIEGYAVHTGTAHHQTTLKANEADRAPHYRRHRLHHSDKHTHTLSLSLSHTLSLSLCVVSRPHSVTNTYRCDTITFHHRSSSSQILLGTPPIAYVGMAI